MPTLRGRATELRARLGRDSEIALLRDTKSASEHERLVADALSCGADAVSVAWQAVDTSFAGYVRGHGLRLYSWCRARGARILGIVTKGDDEAAACMDDFITISRCHPLVATIPAVVALQLFSYHVARLRGCEIDQPRNLAKSVTVE